MRFLDFKWLAHSASGRRKLSELSVFKLENPRYLPHGLNGTVVNQTCHSLNIESSEFACLVPLNDLITNLSRVSTIPRDLALIAICRAESPHYINRWIERWIEW